jgi:hypothetical protein
MARLRGLANTLPQKRYSEEAWRKLLGDAPDWRRISACASASDYCQFSFASITKWHADKPFVSFALKCLESGIFFWDGFVMSPVYNLFVYSDALLGIYCHVLSFICVL